MEKTDEREELESILTELQDLSFDVESNLFLIDHLSAIYRNESFRHSYYELSRYMQELSEEERETVCANVDAILEYINNSDSYKFDDKLCKGVFKLSDHLNLETIRINRINGSVFNGEEAKEKIDEANRLYDNYQEQVTKLSNRVTQFHGQSIAILGIFAGLVIGFATGSNLMISTLENITQNYILELLIYIFAIGLTLFNILFLLMYCVAKISGTSIAVTCTRKECESCKKHLLKRLYYKYPYVVLFNIGAILCYAILLCFIIFYKH